MTKCRTFQVASIGFSAVETTVLKSIAGFASSSTREYVLLDELQFNAADILFLQADAPSAVAKYRAQPPNKKQVVVIVTSKDLPSRTTYIMHKPVNGYKIMVALHSVTIKYFRYLPELQISDDAEIDKLTQSALDSAWLHEELPQRCMIVVDDSETIRSHMEAQLRILGFNPVCAGDGYHGLQLVKKLPCEAVFLDVNLPDLDGFEVCRTIKTDHATKHIPVIMLTGRSRRTAKMKGILAGCDDYLTKPVDQAQLWAAIKKIRPQTSGMEQDNQIRLRSGNERS